MTNEEQTNRIARFVGGLKKAAFEAVDGLCTILIASDVGASPTITALKAACEVRKSQQRRRAASRGG